MIEDQYFVVGVIHYSINFKLSEDISMNNNSDAVIEECINKLQGLLGSSGTPSSSSDQPRAAVITQFDANLAKCLERA